MKHLKELLMRLQTFELKVVQRKEYKGGNSQPVEAQAYDISHETKYYESYTFETNLRILTDMATIDLIGLDTRRVQLVLGQLIKMKERFRAFWTNYHGHFFKNDHPYRAGYITQIRLHELFLIRNLEPEYANILIEEKFVDDLGDSVSLRESVLGEFIQHAQSLAPDAAAHQELRMGASCRSTQKITGWPTFVDGIAKKYFEIIKNYFSPEDQIHLQSLLQENQVPPSPLLFHGNGNQLVDAFKQLYEANLIVGCLKGELEEWIGANFEYVYRNEQKALPANYLNAIISTNSKPCQSPILDVRKQPDGRFIIVPVLRTKKNYNPDR